jgi:hypothetical protein
MVAQCYFEEPNATKMEVLRQQRRASRRLIYDCSRARVDTDHRVRCRWGYMLSGADGVALLSVLRGMTPRYCQTCQDYEAA